MKYLAKKKSNSGMDSTVRCVHCGKPVEDTGSQLAALRWIHVDGFFNCDGNRGHSNDNAEPEKAKESDRA